MSACMGLLALHWSDHWAALGLNRIHIVLHAEAANQAALKLEHVHP